MIWVRIGGARRGFRRIGIISGFGAVRRGANPVIVQDQHKGKYEPAIPAFMRGRI